MTETIVYHGGPEAFNRFDYSRVQTNGTSEGLGFYFTDDKRIANDYAKGGYILTARFTGTKSLNPEKLTISKSSLRAFLSALNKKVDYLSNWGDIDYEGYDNVLNKAIQNEYAFSTNDVDLIAGICNTTGNTEAVLTLCYELLGFDSIVVEGDWTRGAMLYIATVHEAYEVISVTPVTKTSS